jgi:DNA-nicking Smr family endonuclease
MPPRPRSLTEADRAEWAQFARQIARLPGRHPLPSESGSVEAPPPAAILPPRPPPLTAAASARVMPAPVTIGGTPPGVDSATWQRFRGGKLTAARRLDLHGLTTQRAFHALTAFLRTAHADHVRCVEVVTGRGSSDSSGTIRREFPIWLNLPDIRPLILAASHPHAANPGSVRLLLRRIR